MYGGWIGRRPFLLICRSCGFATTTHEQKDRYSEAGFVVYSGAPHRRLSS